MKNFQRLPKPIRPRASQTLAMALTLTALSLTPPASAQPVKVFLSLETNRLAVGATTKLSVSAQITPEFKPLSDQIFSWNVDLLNGAGAVAQIKFSALQKPASDNDPRTSSSGTASGSDI